MSSGFKIDYTFPFVSFLWWDLFFLPLFFVQFSLCPPKFPKINNFYSPPYFTKKKVHIVNVSYLLLVAVPIPLNNNLLNDIYKGKLKHYIKKIYHICLLTANFKYQFKRIIKTFSKPVFPPLQRAFFPPGLPPSSDVGCCPLSFSPAFAFLLLSHVV